MEPFHRNLSTFGLSSIIITSTSETVPSAMCAQRRFKSDCANAQSDQNLHSAHFDSQGCSFFKRTTKTDQTVRMRRLICVFVGRILSEGTFFHIVSH